MAEGEDFLNLHVEGGLAILTVNRPRVLNSLSIAVLEEMRKALRQLAQDRTVRVVVLTGAGDKAFIAGADIQEMLALTTTGMREFSRLGQEVVA